MDYATGKNNNTPYNYLPLFYKQYHEWRYLDFAH